MTRAYDPARFLVFASEVHPDIRVADAKGLYVGKSIGLKHSHELEYDGLVAAVARLPAEDRGKVHLTFVRRPKGRRAA